MSESICVRQSNNLLTVDTTHIAGYECTAEWLYIIVCIIAIVLQIARNIVWTKASQATREALHEPQGEERTPFIARLLWYTFIQMMLYIVNILLILGGNLGILGCVLIGNLLGTYLSMKREKADKARTAVGLTTMIKEYNALVEKTPRSEEDVEHLRRLEETKSLLNAFLKTDVLLVQKQPPPVTNTNTFSF